MAHRSRSAALLLGVLLALGAVAPAVGAEKRHSAKNAAKEGAKTGGRTAKEGVLTFGRSVKGDRKSTRLNSSHSQISYAVFCLKKKKKVQKVSGSKREYRVRRSQGI